METYRRPITGQEDRDAIEDDVPDLTSLPEPRDSVQEDDSTSAQMPITKDVRGTGSALLRTTLTRPSTDQAADFGNMSQPTQSSVVGQYVHNNPTVAALESLQPGGSFPRPLLTVDELKGLSMEQSDWSLSQLQFRLASIAHNDYTSGFGRRGMDLFMDPANLQQLLPVNDPLINARNPSFTAKKGQNYVIGRIMSSAQGRIVHQDQNACANCQKAATQDWGKKRYGQCVTVADANGNAILGGACSNCAHNDHPESCSFYTKA